MKLANAVNAVCAFVVTGLIIAPCVHAKPVGIDVSNNNGSVNWTSAYNNSNIRFGFAKATEGQYFQDGYYHNNMSNGKLAGCLMGAYDFARPASDDPQNEANYFYNFASANFNIGGQTIGPVLDLEVFTGHVNANSYTDWANQWGAKIISRMHADGRTCNWILYTSSCSACNFGGSITGSPWMANYNGQDSQTGTPWSSCSSCNVWPGDGWRFWQFTATASVSGVSGGCDKDVYDGLLSDLMSSDLIMHSYP
ncbi:MAG: glycoside hydrolase family 25 protein [Limisphaerales bacterium]